MSRKLWGTVSTHFREWSRRQSGEDVRKIPVRFLRWRDLNKTNAAHLNFFSSAEAIQIAYRNMHKSYARCTVRFLIHGRHARTLARVLGVRWEDWVGRWRTRVVGRGGGGREVCKIPFIHDPMNWTSCISLIPYIKHPRYQQSHI